MYRHDIYKAWRAAGASRLDPDLAVRYWMNLRKALKRQRAEAVRIWNAGILNHADVVNGSDVA